MAMQDNGRVHNSPDGDYWYIYLPMAYHQHQWLLLVLSIGSQFCRPTSQVRITNAGFS